MISRRTWCDSSVSDAPNSNAPSEPCKPITSAPYTIRNSTPSSKPRESCGTWITRCNSATSGGSTRDDSIQDTTAKPATLPIKISIPTGETS